MYLIACPHHPWPHGHGPIEACPPLPLGAAAAPIHGLTAMAPLKLDSPMPFLAPQVSIHGLTAMAPLKLDHSPPSYGLIYPSMASRPWPH